MIKNIVRDKFFLSIVSSKATPEDMSAGENLMDTLKANNGRCVGMAANMIGVSKRIIAIEDNRVYVLMYNPEIIKAESIFEAEEGCLALDGTRKTKRYKTIKVRYEDAFFRPRIKTYRGFTAQIIQHEIDHLNGILI